MQVHSFKHTHTYTHSNTHKYAQANTFFVVQRAWHKRTVAHTSEIEAVKYTCRHHTYLFSMVSFNLIYVTCQHPGKSCIATCKCFNVTVS